MYPRPSESLKYLGLSMVTSVPVEMHQGLFRENREMNLRNIRDLGRKWRDSMNKMKEFQRVSVY
jgi:hypothetical protein